MSKSLLELHLPLVDLDALVIVNKVLPHLLGHVQKWIRLCGLAISDTARVAVGQVNEGLSGVDTLSAVPVVFALALRLAFW